MYTHAEERCRQLHNELQQADQFRALVRELRQAQRRWRAERRSFSWSDRLARKRHLDAIAETRDRLAAAVDRELGLLESE